MAKHTSSQSTFPKSPQTSIRKKAKKERASSFQDLREEGKKEGEKLNPRHRGDERAAINSALLALQTYSSRRARQESRLAGDARARGAPEDSTIIAAASAQPSPK